LGFARRIAPGDSPALRYLSRAIFPVYILHQTVIVLLAVQFRPLQLDPRLEGPLLAALTFALCLAGYESIRRVPVLRPLLGLKYRDADAKPRAAAEPGQAAAGAQGYPSGRANRGPASAAADARPQADGLPFRSRAPGRPDGLPTGA